MLQLNDNQPHPFLFNFYLKNNCQFYLIILSEPLFLLSSSLTIRLAIESDNTPKFGAYKSADYK